MFVQPQPAPPQAAHPRLPAPAHRSSVLPTCCTESAPTALLTAEEERALALRIQAGDQAARTRLIEANLRFVVRIATRYCPVLPTGMELDDLVQEGTLGLMRAVDKFRPHEHGTRFTTYAFAWVHQAINRALNDRGHTVHIPDYRMQHVRAAWRMTDTLTHTLNREPTLAEVADALGIRQEDLQLAVASARHPSSLDAPLSRTDGAPAGDIGTCLLDQLEDRTALTPEEAACLTCLTDELRAVLSACLSPRACVVLTLRYGLDGQPPRSLSQVGRVLALSKERVRQLQTEALARIRCSRQMRALGIYVGVDVKEQEEGTQAIR